MNELLDVIDNITELIIHMNKEQNNNEEQNMLILLVIIMITAIVMRIF